MRTMAIDTEEQRNTDSTARIDLAKTIRGGVKLPISDLVPERHELVQELSGSDAAAQERLCLLRALDQFETLRVGELPVRQPLSRRHVSALVGWLEADGLVEGLDLEGPIGQRRVRITELGRSIVEEIDWTTAVEAEYGRDGLVTRP